MRDALLRGSCGDTRGGCEGAGASERGSGQAGIAAWAASGWRAGARLASEAVEQGRLAGPGRTWQGRDGSAGGRTLPRRRNKDDNHTDGTTCCRASPVGTARAKHQADTGGQINSGKHKLRRQWWRRRAHDCEEPAGGRGAAHSIQDLRAVKHAVSRWLSALLRRSRSIREGRGAALALVFFPFLPVSSQVMSRHSTPTGTGPLSMAPTTSISWASLLRIESRREATVWEDSGAGWDDIKLKLKAQAWNADRALALQKDVQAAYDAAGSILDKRAAVCARTGEGQSTFHNSPVLIVGLPARASSSSWDAGRVCQRRRLRRLRRGAAQVDPWRCGSVGLTAARAPAGRGHTRVVRSSGRGAELRRRPVTRVQHAMQQRGRPILCQQGRMRIGATANKQRGIASIYWYCVRRIDMMPTGRHHHHTNPRQDATTWPRPPAAAAAAAVTVGASSLQLANCCCSPLLTISAYVSSSPLVAPTLHSWPPLLYIENTEYPVCCAHRVFWRPAAPKVPPLKKPRWLRRICVQYSPGVDVAHPCRLKKNHYLPGESRTLLPKSKTLTGVCALFCGRPAASGKSPAAPPALLWERASACARCAGSLPALIASKQPILQEGECCESSSCGGGAHHLDPRCRCDLQPALRRPRRPGRAHERGPAVGVEDGGGAPLAGDDGRPLGRVHSEHHPQALERRRVERC